MTDQERTILLVEDDDQQRQALATLLRARGFTVREAASGEEALTHLAAAPSRAMLLDWVLPGLSAWDLLGRIRADADLATLPVAIASGYPERAGPASVLSGVAFLPKPLNIDEVERVLVELIETPRPEVLLVDDEPAVGAALAFALRHHGLAVRVASGGAEALTVFRRHNDTIGLVLLDVMMPVLDGPQTLAQIAEFDPSVRAVFMSSYIGEYSAEELLALGALRVVPKPFPDIAELARVLRQLATQPRLTPVSAPH